MLNVGIPVLMTINRRRYDRTLITSRVNGINLKVNSRGGGVNLQDDDLIQIEGDYEKFKGLAQERSADRKEELVAGQSGTRSCPNPEAVGQSGRK